MVKIGEAGPLVETRSSSSSPIGSSKYSEGSHIGGSISLPLKKSQGWIGGDVGLSGKICLWVFVLLRGMKIIYFCIFSIFMK